MLRVAYEITRGYANGNPCTKFYVLLGSKKVNNIVGQFCQTIDESL